MLTPLTFIFVSEPTSSSLGPISINCNAHSTTSPKSSPNQVGLLTTAGGGPLSPPEDDISVTASPTPSPQPPPAFPGAIPPPIQNNHLFNNALAASLFLNAPLLPPPGQWLYSQFYPQDWSWMHLRHPSMITGPRSSSPQETNQNPDSSSKIDVTELDDSKSVDVDDSQDSKTTENKSETKKTALKEEGVNLTVCKGRKASVTLVRQKDEVSSSECSKRSNNNRHSDVWRPY